MGSKNRLAKRLLPIILKDRKPNQIYIEPFCGGCNMIDKVQGPRWPNDSNFYLVELFKALQNGWNPPRDISPELYRQVREGKDRFPPELVAFVGFPCSFGSKWFGGFAKNSVGRNYADEGAANLEKQRDNLMDVRFTNQSYLELSIPDGSLIYCDPPYANTTSYKNVFDNNIFWEWVRDKSTTNQVFVSEYSAPDDFECLIEIAYSTTMNKNSKDKRIEKMFRHKETASCLMG